MSDNAPKMPALAEDRLWRVPDVATYLQMSISWVKKRVAAAEIPFIRLGGHAIRFEPEKIKAWAQDGGGAKVLDFKR